MVRANWWLHASYGWAVLASRGGDRGSAPVLALPRSRAVQAALLYVAAFVLFVAIDAPSGRAITRLADDRMIVGVALGITLGVIVGAALALSRRPSSSHP
jgi:hypothetical protein